MLPKPTDFDLETLEQAHRHCFRNRSEVLASDLCGCFSCLRVFPSTEITNWADETEQPPWRGNLLVPNNDPTAICPSCCVDAVIGSNSGYPIEADFLKAMHERWFGKLQD